MQKTILVIDDFSTSLFVIENTLKTQGYNVLKALSGNEALKFLTGQTIDLIITDYNMPVMNGIEFVVKVKQDQRYVKTPIFILSTETSQEVKDCARAAGVTAWIKKPFDIQKLLKFIEKSFI